MTRGTATAQLPAPTTLNARVSRQGDRLFKAIAAAAGFTIVVAIALIAVFLLLRAVPSLRVNHANFFTSAQFSTSDPHRLAFGIRDLLMVTVLSSLSALVLAVPIAVGIAVFLTQYAPRRLARPFGAIVDLLAAVPSIIFGLWGFSCWPPARAGGGVPQPPPGMVLPVQNRQRVVGRRRHHLHRRRRAR